MAVISLGLASLTVADSLALVGTTLTLVNDVLTPGNSMFYGTSGAGVRGWYSLGLADVTSAQGTAGQVLVNGTSATPTMGDLTFTLASALAGINSITSVAGQNLILALGTGGTALTLTTSTLAAAFAGALSVTGHTTFEGITSTGATGTGNLVYSITPTLTGSPIVGGVTFSTSAATSLNSITSTALSNLTLGTGTFGTALTFTSATGAATFAATADSTTAITGSGVFGGGVGMLKSLVQGNATASVQHEFYGGSASAAPGGRINAYKSRTGGVLTTGDQYLALYGYGHDGTGYIEAGGLFLRSIGTIATNRTPSQWEFWTHPDSTSADRLAVTIGADASLTVAGSILGSGGTAPTNTTSGSNQFTVGLATNGPFYGTTGSFSGAATASYFSSTTGNSWLNQRADSTGYAQLVYLTAAGQQWATGQRAGDSSFHLYDNTAGVDVQTWALSTGNSVLRGTLTVSSTGTSSVGGNLQVGAANTGNYILTPATNTGTGSLTIQAGAGSSAWGGTLILYSAANASHAGDFVVGLGTSGAQFRINSGGLDGGSDLVTMGRTVGSGATFNYTTSGTSTTAAAILGKSMGLTENLFVGGAISAGSTTNAVNVSTGSGIFAGGVGIASALYVGQNVNLASNGTYSTTAWATQGAYLRVGLNTTVTDTSSSGTVASMVLSTFNAGTVAASSATTYTDAATLYVVASPNAGANVSFTSGWGFWNASKTRLDGLVSVRDVTEATAGGAGSLTTAGGFYATKAIISGSTTASTSLITGAMILAGANAGLAVTGNILNGGGQGWGVTSIATAGATTTLTNASTAIQVFTGSLTQIVALPAANAYGAGVALVYIVKNRSLGNVTIQRAGTDLIDGISQYVLGTMSAITLCSDGISNWELI